MTKWLFIVPGIYLAAVLNSVVAPLVLVRGVSPDFLALAAALAALCVGGTSGLVAACLAGVLADVGAPGRLGVSMAVWAVAGLALERLQPLTARGPLMQTMAAWVAVSSMLFGAALARGLLGELNWSLSPLVAGSLMAGLYSALLALPFCWLFHRLGRLRQGKLL